MRNAKMQRNGNVNVKLQRNGHVMEIEMSTCETSKYKQMENVNVKLQSGNVNVKI